jgi:hypothetical protein
MASVSDFVECGAGVDGFGDRVTSVFESQAKYAAKAVFVFDKKDIGHPVDSIPQRSKDAKRISAEVLRF